MYDSKCDFLFLAIAIMDYNLTSSKAEAAVS